jgi:Lipase (class 3)
MRVRKQVQKLVDDFTSKHGRPPTILISGFSLGSSCATAGLLAFARYFSNASIFCILGGAPRSGNAKYINELKAQSNVKAVWRVVYKHDPGSQVPLDWGFGGFKHVPDPWLHLNEDPSLTKWYAPLSRFF